MKNTLPLNSVTSDSSKAYMSELYEKDLGQITDNTQIIAKRFILTGQIPNADIVNEVLGLKDDQQITLDTLEMFSKITPHVIEDLPITRDDLTELHGKAKSQGSTPDGVGCYVFTNKSTGEQYVGSSRNLSDRVRQHIRGNGKTSLANEIAKYGSKAFKLEIYYLPHCPTFMTSLTLAFEQYLIFLLNPQINQSKVANAPPRGRTAEQLRDIRINTGKPTFAYYTDDDGVKRLVFKFVSAGEVGEILNKYSKFGQDTIQKHKGLFRNRLLFSFSLDETVPVSLYTVGELQEMFAQLQALPVATSGTRNAVPLLVKDTRDGTTKFYPTKDSFRVWASENSYCHHDKKAFRSIIEEGKLGPFLINVLPKGTKPDSYYVTHPKFLGETP